MERLCRPRGSQTSRYPWPDELSDVPGGLAVECEER
jgi:hypothetical protein